VFVGHQHVYSRLKPLTGGAPDYEDGVVYIMGNSGLKHYSSADESLAERTIYDTPTYQLVSLDGDSMTVQTFDGNGNELDFIALSPRENKASSAFSDLPPSAWYSEAASRALEAGWMDPADENSFGAADTTTRAVFAAALYRLEGGSVGNGENAIGAAQVFSDVPAGTELAAAVSWAAAAGIVNGVGDGNFAPEAGVTREQLAAMLFRYAAWKNAGAAPRGDLSVFTDAARISPWAEEAMAWALGAGIVRGMGDGSAAPRGSCSRAQTAQILYNYSKAI
jgi:hypothetical protein